MSTPSPKATYLGAVPTPTSAHLIVTVDGPIKIDGKTELIPLLGLLVGIIAALIAGFFAIRAAAKTAAGAFAAAQEQARGVQEAALKQSSAIIEAQHLALQSSIERDREKRERAANARRRRLVPLLRNLALQFYALGTTPGTDQEKDVMSWRVAQLERSADDDDLIEMLSAAESDALHEALDQCKARYSEWLKFDAFLKKNNDPKASKYYTERCQRLARLVLRDIRTLFGAMQDPTNVAFLDELMDVVPDPDAKRRQARQRPASPIPDDEGNTSQGFNRSRF